MITYAHVPLMILSFLILLAMWRFWSCIDRMGFMLEVNRRAPSMLQVDIVGAILAIMPFLLAAVDWAEIILPRQDTPISSNISVFLSTGCLLGYTFILRESGERFAGHWAGSRESALRTVAALRIIDAAELAHALRIAQQHETINSVGHVINPEKREDRK